MLRTCINALPTATVLCTDACGSQQLPILSNSIKALEDAHVRQSSVHVSLLEQVRGNQGILTSTVEEHITTSSAATSLMGAGLEEILAKVSASQTELQELKAILSEIRQQNVQSNAVPISTSATVQELNDDGVPIDEANGTSLAKDTEFDVADRRMMEAVERLSQFVHEKEKAIQVAYSEEKAWEPVIEALKSILDVAKQKANDLLHGVSPLSHDERDKYDQLERGIGHLRNVFFSNMLTINPNGKGWSIFVATNGC
jgi:hypothetical protein